MNLFRETIRQINLFRMNRKIRSSFHNKWMLFCLIILIAVPFILVGGLVLKSKMLVENNSLLDLLFSSKWEPSKGEFGFLPFIVSSLWVTLLSLLISAPICLLSAILLTQYAKKWVMRVMLPVIDILAGIPSVIYGVWGILVIIPLVSEHIAPFFNIKSSGYSILTGAIVLSVMIIPFILNILIEIFKSIPKELTEVSLSLGSTKWGTIKRVLLRRAAPGIVSSFGLGLSRAFGETIAVLMVVGNVVKIPSGIFQPGYPIPALIANNYGEMLSIPLYDSALMFAALILLLVVIMFNLASRVAIIRFERKL